MCMSAGARRPTGGVAQVRWLCPEKHEESDDAPVLPRAFCVECDRFYEWAEVALLGPSEELGLVAAGMSQ
jgi:hypothetical protein